MARPAPVPALDRAPGRRRRAFTMVELLVVVVIIALLLALLLPAITAAIRATKNAQAVSDIHLLSTALNQFKSQYQDYPPSRIYLNEAGGYPVSSTAAVATGNSTDITLGQLAQRSLIYLRKFFPRATFSVAGNIYTNSNTGPWHDFNGNGTLDGAYVLQGHECLVFFLGGIPYNTGSGLGMSGFGKNALNPFTNNINGNVMYSGQRYAPLFEFRPTRLVIDPNGTSGIPGYIDTFGNTLSPNLGGFQVNFYAYFSAYGTGGYDPNDVNFPNESDNLGNAPIMLSTNVTFPCFNSSGNAAGPVAVSPSPNPYSTSLTNTVSGNNAPQATVFQNPNTFQIISSGNDGLYGVGGQWSQSGTAGSLPMNAAAINSADMTIRQREGDNLSNFSTSKLE